MQKIEYFEFDFPMIKKTTNETLNKLLFKGGRTGNFTSLYELSNIWEYNKQVVETESNEKFWWNLVGWGGNAISKGIKCAAEHPWVGDSVF